MQLPIRISAAKARADFIGASWTQLCLEAGQAPSTVYRWLTGQTEPRLNGYTEACVAIENLLDEREAELLAHLTSRPVAAE